MELQVKERTVAASRQKYGIDVIELQAGQHLKIETSPNGVEVLDVVCPDSSSWTVQVSIIINEIDL